ncbi:CRISPR-associated endoribonuclease Cas6 [Streptomyces polyrhachis]|uniref:CRISPR-associated endoribonuclease Cas6 n=1 Tax=Streptomyces polyrhachis TaxID=1282885 RepID=A0ABW2G7Z4_9ACTN
MEFGSPLPEVVEALGTALAATPVLAWGATAFLVDGVEIVEDRPFSSGYAVFRTSTPVIMKGSGLDATGKRTTRQSWRLPGEPEWDSYVENNLRRKADTLGLDREVSLEQVTWVGPKRSFAVSASNGPGGKKPGARVEVTVSGDPRTLTALADWGLGQGNSTGFGWISL